MAMPTSARERTGASLMPSPTKASTPVSAGWASSSSTLATLPSGSSPAWVSSRPRAAATRPAAAGASPVSITVLRTPRALSCAMASGASGLISSEMTRYPA